MLSSGSNGQQQQIVSKYEAQSQKLPQNVHQQYKQTPDGQQYIEEEYYIEEEVEEEGEEEM